MAWEIGAYEYIPSGPTPSVGTITFAGLLPIVSAPSGAWTITDVDTDEIITDGQIGVVCTVTNGAASGKRIFLAQGATWVEQEVTGETPTTVTINVSFGGVLTAGAATLHGWNPL